MAETAHTLSTTATPFMREAAIRYPVFHDPEEYLELRRGKWPLRGIKRWAEYRAIRTCLDRTRNVTSLCDCPCGPGRLFDFRRRLDLPVYAVDLSPDMTAAAGTLHRRMGLRGGVFRGDAFNLKAVVPSAVDLVCSLRFLYYFGEEHRQYLLHSLAEVTRRYLLLQYKTCDTLRGRRNARREARKPEPSKVYLSTQDIEADVQRAGFELLSIVPIGFASDRVFVICRV